MKKYTDNLLVAISKDYCSGKYSLSDLAKKYNINASYLSQRLSEIMGMKIPGQVEKPKRIDISEEPIAHIDPFSEQAMLNTRSSRRFLSGLLAGEHQPSKYTIPTHPKL